MDGLYVAGFQVLSWAYVLLGILVVGATVSIVSRAQAERWPGGWPQLLMVGAILSLTGSFGSAVSGLVSFHHPVADLLLLIVDLAGGGLLLAGIATIEVPAAKRGQHV